MKKILLIISCVLFSGIFFFSPVKAESPTPAPTFPPFPTLAIPDPVPACYVGGITGSHDETIYPPNSACYAEVKRTQSKIKDYTKTCIKEPIVTYEDFRSPSEAGCMGEDGFPCDVYITVTTDISKAELGSYGPSYDTLLTSSSSADTIAKKYLFNSLFDRPYFSTEDTPREAWRTYWRLMPFNEQANLTAQFINLVLLPDNIDGDTLKRINNTKYQYINSKGKIKEITVKKLAGQLPKCLKTEPVCADYVSEYYNLNQETKDAYDSLIPLSFNNLRGFIALSPPNYPDLNNIRPPLPGTVSRESIPYIEPIFSGLLSSKYGLLANLQPDWLFTKSIEDLTDTNTGYDLTTGKDNYISGQYQGSFDDIGLNPTVLDNADIVTCPEISNIYNISAPRTFPKDKFNGDPNHIQEIQILGSTLNWDLEVSNVRKRIDRNGNFIEYVCVEAKSEICNTGQGKQCCRYKVTGSGTGKALTVFNNPKTTDIKESVVGNPETSLYSTLIPMDLITPTPTDKKIDAPTSNHTAISTILSGTGSVSNPDNPIIRENNLAQDTVHVIQNCWLVPGDQQSSTKCERKTVGLCDGTKLQEIIGGNVTSPSSKALSFFTSSIMPIIEQSPELMEAYIAGEEATGVPCEVLAGIHYEEADNNPNLQLADGSPLAGMSLVDSAIWAGEHLNSKTGDNKIDNLDELIMALSRYNGGGNSNCRRGYPWPIPYNYCPREGEGYDDPYAVNWWKSPEHDTMYLLYIYDSTPAVPQVHLRPGAFTVALSLYLNE